MMLQYSIPGAICGAFFMRLYLKNTLPEYVRLKELNYKIIQENVVYENLKRTFVSFCIESMQTLLKK